MAHSVKQDKTAPSCWNCGSTSYIKANCKAPPSRCDNCGKLGHIARLCLQGKARSEINQSTTSSNSGDKGKKIMKKEVNERSNGTSNGKHSKGDRKKMLMKKAMAHLVEEMSTIDDEEEEFVTVSDNESQDYELASSPHERDRCYSL